MEVWLCNTPISDGGNFSITTFETTLIFSSGGKSFQNWQVKIPENRPAFTFVHFELLQKIRISL
jgi:hypothetical protein